MGIFDAFSPCFFRDIGWGYSLVICCKSYGTCICQKCQWIGWTKLQEIPKISLGETMVPLGFSRINQPNEWGWPSFSKPWLWKAIFKSRTSVRSLWEGIIQSDIVLMSPHNPRTEVRSLWDGIVVMFSRTFP